MRHCLLCGLHTDELEIHQRSAHGSTSEEIEEMTRDGLDGLARDIETSATKSGLRVRRFEDVSTGGAMREGGYL